MPGFHDLVDDLVPSLGRLIESVRPKFDQEFAEPYTTTPGVVLRTPAQALNFSMMHDGIHIGMILALKRALAAAGTTQPVAPGSVA